MKKLTFALFLFLTTAIAFGQSKKVALLTTSLSTDDELNYETFVRPYIEGHLKNLPGVTSVSFSAAVSNAVKIKRGAAAGTFIDNNIVKAASETGSNLLMVVYYNVSNIEKKVLDPGMESTSYGCDIDLNIQLVNTSTAQIISSKPFHFSKGEQYKVGENFKTKEEAVKAAFASQAFSDEKKTVPANLDVYLAENIK